MLKKILNRVLLRHEHQWKTTHTNRWMIPTVQVCECGLSRTKEVDSVHNPGPWLQRWRYSDGTIGPDEPVFKHIADHGVAEKIVCTFPRDLEWPFDEQPTHVWDDPYHERYVDWYCESIRDADHKLLRNVLRLNQKTGSHIYVDVDANQEVASSARGPLVIKRRIER